jgi:hypothetical protein
VFPTGEVSFVWMYAVDGDAWGYWVSFGSGLEGDEDTVCIYALRCAAKLRGGAGIS